MATMSRGHDIVSQVLREAEKPLSARELVELAGYSHSYTKTILNELRAGGMEIHRVLCGMNGRGGPVALYSLSREAGIAFQAEAREAARERRLRGDYPARDALLRVLRESDVALDAHEIAEATGYLAATVRTTVYWARRAGHTVHTIKIPRPTCGPRCVYTTCPGIAAMARTEADEVRAELHRKRDARNRIAARRIRQEHIPGSRERRSSGSSTND